jgi:hypothetical protein
MNLYVFGNSITFRKPVMTRNSPKTFVDILFEKYNVPDYDHLYSAACCSEERILYFLKKIKEIDIAIIFHSLPEFFFVPALERDFNAIGENNYFWTDPNWNHLNILASVQEDKPITLHEWRMLRNYINFDNFTTSKNFKSDFYSYIKYFHTHDLCHNRHYGALAQIDQYLTHMKIPVIHCTLPRSCPTWFKFNSGIVDTEISKFQYTIHPNHCSHAKVANAVDEEGNKIIADTLIGYIEQLVGETGIEPI